MGVNQLAARRQPGKCEFGSLWISEFGCDWPNRSWICWRGTCLRAYKHQYLNSLFFAACFATFDWSSGETCNEKWKIWLVIYSLHHVQNKLWSILRKTQRIEKENKVSALNEGFHSSALLSSSNFQTARSFEFDETYCIIFDGIWMTVIE